jgi:phosphoribosylanthranilate isomerase
MVGVVFARSRRQVTVETAVRVREAVDASGCKARLAGVFVNESLERVLTAARLVGLDVVQLSGDESPEYVAMCSQFYPVIKAVRFPVGSCGEEALEVLSRYERAASYGGERLRFLVDGYRPGQYGGTGSVADWALAAQVAARYEIMLAGGLNSGNVADAVSMVSPWGVDVSSGVESGGVKDPGLIREFLRAAKAMSDRKESR